jgi:hypothetical protein
MTRLRFKTDGSSLKNIDAAVRAGSIPLLVRRGGRDSKKMTRSPLGGAAGVVAHTAM